MFDGRLYSSPIEGNLLISFADVLRPDLKEFLCFEKWCSCILLLPSKLHFSFQGAWVVAEAVTRCPFGAANGHRFFVFDLFEEVANWSPLCPCFAFLPIATLKEVIIA